MKKQILLSIVFLFILHSSWSQKTYSPAKKGLIQEFSGKVKSVYEYDGDFFFTLKDPKYGEIDLYFRAGSCHTDGDPYAIDYEISDETYELFSGENAKGIKIKVTAKSTYGLFCGNCDECEKNRQTIWRPIKIKEIK